MGLHFSILLVNVTLMVPDLIAHITALVLSKSYTPPPQKKKVGFFVQKERDEMAKKMGGSAKSLWRRPSDKNAHSAATSDQNLAANCRDSFATPYNCACHDKPTTPSSEDCTQVTHVPYHEKDKVK
jgi:hypothetical protein